MSLPSTIDTVKDLSEPSLPHLTQSTPNKEELRNDGEHRNEG
jgi:hypothetical protein